MPTTIKDGTGTGHEAEVNAEHQLVVRAITEAELEHASIGGTAFVWYSGVQDIDITDTMLFLKNTSSTPLILDRLNLTGSNVICTWGIHIGGDVTTPTGGSVVTGVNTNQQFSSAVAEAVARTDEESVADGALLENVVTPVTIIHHHVLEGIILGQGHYIQINQDTESTSGAAAIFAHYENPSS